MANQSKRKKTSRKTQAQSSNPKQLRIIILAAVLVAVGGYFFYARSNQTQGAYALNNASVDIEILKGGETRPTLSPVLFVGKVAKAYNLASENRELLDSIYCYCNCKKTFGHKSLLTCYVDKHAADCKICIDQTLYAYARYQEGNDIAQVRFAVDKKFWKPLR